MNPALADRPLAKEKTWRGNGWKTLLYQFDGVLVRTQAEIDAESLDYSWCNFCLKRGDAK